MSENLKVIVMGDSNVGKSSLLRRLAGESFDESIQYTTGVEYYHRQWRAKRKDVNLQFWDTAGQERFRAIIPRYYGDAHAVIAVFDLTSKASFNSLEYWLQELQRYGPSDCAIILVGNKADLSAQRQVSPKDRLPWSSSSKYPTMIEVSAKTLKQPNSLLDKIAAKALKVNTLRVEKLKEEDEQERIRLHGDDFGDGRVKKKRRFLCY